MARRISNPVTLGIILGVVLGVLVSKGLDHWSTPVLADANGKKAALDQSMTFRVAAKTIAPAVVNITTMQRVRYAVGGGLSFNGLGVPFYRRPKIKEDLVPRGVGSGFVFDATNGYIMTNSHVVAEGETWVVRLPDHRELEAKLVGADPQTDVAVLKIDAKNLTAATLGDSNQLEVGDWVLAVGNPFGLLEQTITAGIISAKGRHGMGISNYEDLLQTDAAINPGNSGGPLVNLNGEVVGVNTAIYSRSGGYQGIGFAIPMSQAKKIALRLTRNGAVTRGFMGVQLQDLSATDAKKYSVDGGASVEGVFMNGPADKAGLLPGDILIKVDGKPIKSSEEVRDTVADMAPGTKVPLTVQRAGKVETMHLTVGQQPKNWGLNRSDNE